MKPKHSPAPWKSLPVDAVETVIPMVEVYAANNSVVARRIADPDDARLITAAPLLLNALKHFVGAYETVLRDRPELKAEFDLIYSWSVDAIRKAEEGE